MPSLRKLTRNPHVWFALVFVTFFLTFLDSLRSPPKQVTVKAYSHAICLYQATSGPILSKFVCCRYHPTCSAYSIAAVQKHGIRKGLLLSVKRFMSCTKKVPNGTPDPVLD